MTAHPAPTLPPHEGLTIGSRGRAVRRLQVALRYGYGQPILADGIFGPQTEAALRRVKGSAP